MEKKRILIYGDSNTHGFRVSDGLRFPAHIRWTGVCQQKTGEWAEILEEGLNGRTTCFDEMGMEFRNGLAYIQPCIRTHLPLGMVCVMLGSNDLKTEFAQTPESIARHAAEVLEKARETAESKYPGAPCLYTLISPPEVSEALISGPFAFEFEGIKTVEASKSFAKLYQAEATKRDFLFFDAAKHAVPGKIDGLHLDEENHIRLGEAFAKWLVEQFKID